MNTVQKFLLALVLALASGIAQSQTNEALPLPPMTPGRSPVDTFRELLAMSATERAQALAVRPVETRTRLAAKVEEYQALRADERELRLRATELRWWLLSLMRQPATNYAAGIAQIPTHLRALVEARLELWKVIPEPAQKELLENEAVAQLFAQVQGASAGQKEKILSALSPARRQVLETGLDRWGQMSPGERKRTRENFEQFFAFDNRERREVLSTLSDVERKQMEVTLKSFESLPREQRMVCVQSFEKFANLTPTERQQFLRNAERWDKMLPEERQRWRNLVKNVPEFPPLPAEFYAVPMPPEPVPRPKSSASQSTNGGG